MVVTTDVAGGGFVVLVLHQLSRTRPCVKGANTTTNTTVDRYSHHSLDLPAFLLSFPLCFRPQADCKCMFTIERSEFLSVVAAFVARSRENPPATSIIQLHIPRKFDSVPAYVRTSRESFYPDHRQLVDNVRYLCLYLRLDLPLRVRQLLTSRRHPPAVLQLVDEGQD